MEHLVSHALSRIETAKQGAASIDEVIQELESKLQDEAGGQNTIERVCAGEIIQNLKRQKGSVGSLGMGIKNPYPARYYLKKDTDRLKRLNDDKNGLVHGGKIIGKNYDLVCKAFRWFRYQHTYYGKKNRGQMSAIVEEVAGVCDLYSKDGKLLESWSTSTIFPSRYKNTEVELPDVVCQTWKSFVAGKIEVSTYSQNSAIEGFYISNKSLEEEGRVEYDEILDSYTFYHEDSMMVNEEFYTHCRKYLYRDNTDIELQKKWLVDPSYNLPMTGTDTFLINSPYLKVYFPKNTNEALVLLPCVSRKGSVQGGASKTNQHLGKAHWEPKVYEL